jgi:signal transduction histidine kinase
VLLLIAAGYNFVTMLLLIFDTGVRPLAAVSLVADALLAIALLIVSGGAASPLLYFTLFPILTAALRFNWAIDLLTTVSLGVAYLLMGGAWPNVMMLAMAGVVGGALGGRTRKLALDAKRAEEESELQHLRSTREQARAIFEMASTLSATLNYQRILDAVLDVSILGLKEIGPASTRLVSLVLLLSNQGLTVAASRHLSGHDEKLPLVLRDGAISRTLSSAEPVISNDPAHDSELTTYTALHRCVMAVCVPLRAGFENYGVAVFGSPDPGVFTPDNIDVLTAVCNQAIIALQRAALREPAGRARIVEIEEEARKKLARDLHDGPTQSVAAIAMRINYTRNLLQRDPSRVPEELEKIEELARNTTKEIRQMLFTLRPLVLETQGLKAALETLVQKLHDTDPTLAVHLELDDLAETLDKNAQGMIFYIVEEAVGNARKHAQASSIWIRTHRLNGDYVISAGRRSFESRSNLELQSICTNGPVMKAKLDRFGHRQHTSMAAARSGEAVTDTAVARHLGARLDGDRRVDDAVLQPGARRLLPIDCRRPGGRGGWSAGVFCRLAVCRAAGQIAVADRSGHGRQFRSDPRLVVGRLAQPAQSRADHRLARAGPDRSGGAANGARRSTAGR